METGLHGFSEVIFTTECNNPMFAELLAMRLREKLDERVQNIRSDEYDNGWKEGRKKKVADKRKWFSRSFNRE